MSDDPKPNALIAAEPNKGGRPTKYTTELADRICDLVASRVSVWKICAMPDMPSEDTLYRWKRTNAEFSEKYARAREHRAHARQDRIDFIAEQCGEGAIDPTIARVMIDAEKWQMSKEQPKAYGDRIEVDARHLHEHVNRMSDAELERIALGSSERASEATGDPSKLN